MSIILKFFLFSFQLNCPFMPLCPFLFPSHNSILPHSLNFLAWWYYSFSGDEYHNAGSLTRMNSLRTLKVGLPKILIAASWVLVRIITEVSIVHFQLLLCYNGILSSCVLLWKYPWSWDPFLLHSFLCKIWIFLLSSKNISVLLPCKLSKLH